MTAKHDTFTPVDGGKGQKMTKHETVTHENLYAALAAAQGELRNPEKSKKADTGKYQYNYADIGDVLETVLPVLSRHGLALTQPTVIRDNTIVLITRVSFKDESIESEYPVCSLNGNHQAMGAAMTYARRYALTSLVGVAAVDDTDGKDAAPVGEGPREKMSANQAKEELNWAAIQSKIDNAKDLATLDKQAEWIEKRRGYWPDTYYWKAKERITFNRLEKATERLDACKDIDELANEFADLEAALDGKVQYEELAGIYKAAERKLEQ
ncbi:ERF family protein [Oricola thermophila]|uniref:ERF family protein n=1 Tax=Oricola thermophila TaxID=2742145 RepID=A0A6N1VF28_9HYPH|nr:ERF family protein [Oricola thermophila]QKV17822.1 ERF family protein [Oricola thermophila]